MNMKKRLLALCLAICLVVGLLPHIALGASAVTMTGGEQLYLKPNSNWTQSNARWAAYFFDNSANKNVWVGMTAVNFDGIYEVAIPKDHNYPNVIFVRMNPSASANNWNNKWNQTSDLKVPTDGKNLYTITAGSWDAGSWSVK